jgi:hypothetical protein
MFIERFVHTCDGSKPPSKKVSTNRKVEKKTLCLKTKKMKIGRQKMDLRQVFNCI